jgi:hypothetical protein
MMSLAFCLIVAQPAERTVSEFPYGRPVPKVVRDPLMDRARAFFNETASFTDVKTPDGNAAIGARATPELKRVIQRGKKSAARSPSSPTCSNSRPST